MGRGLISDRLGARIRRALVLGVLLLAALFVGGCGGGDASSPTAGGGIGGSGGPVVAGGGVGGTGTGTVTAVQPGSSPMLAGTSLDGGSGAVGSIQLNGFRNFTVTADTLFTIDDVPVNAATFISKGKGLVVRVDVGKDVDAHFTSGTALRVMGLHLLRGPVTGLSPLRVLGQTVVVSDDTVLAGGLGSANPNSPDAGSDWKAHLAHLLAAGTVEVRVSGYLSAEGQVLATRLELVGPPLPEWHLTGTVDAVSDLGFSVGPQAVVAGGVPVQCLEALQPGDLVKVDARRSALYMAALGHGDLLPLWATEVTCARTELVAPDGATGKLRVGLEGLVTNADGGEGFTLRVAGQPVLITEDITYQGGAAEDLVVGARVQVVGLLDVTTGVLTASEVQIAGAEVRIEGDIESSNGDALYIMGIRVERTPATDGDLWLFGGRPSDQLVRVVGRRGLNGTVIARQVRRIRGRSQGHYRIDAPVDFVAAWNDGTFTVLGVSVKVWRADLEDADGRDLTVSEFLDRLSPGTVVSVQDAHYNSRTRTLYWVDKISIR